MSANVTVRRNGKMEMAAVEGVHVWWESDTQKAQRLTASDALDLDKVQAASGMDWEIGRSRVRYGEGAAQLTWEDHHVLFRKDTKEPLGLVSPAYRVVQPRQILELFSDVVGLGGARIETAGTLFGGRKFWCMARIEGAEAAIGSGDIVRGYLLGITSADGSTKTTLTETTVCVVCNNTAQMALAEGGARVTLGHRSELTEARMAALKTRLSETGKNFKTFVETGKLLAKARVDSLAAAAFVEGLLRDQRVIFAEDASKSKAYQSIMSLFDGGQLGAELKARQHTLWGLCNAVTEYVDHHVKSKDRSVSIDSAWLGRGDELKTAAFVKAVAMV
jgi:phage/plasmid-like protein (TIGR03299 family)